MEQLAAAEGLEYHLTDAGLTGNTLDAHQLLQLGKGARDPGRGARAALPRLLHRAAIASSIVIAG